MFTARLNGRQSSVNVGDDAHIVPLRGVPPAGWGGYFALFHSTYRSVPWGYGSMEGIDPYIETVGAFHSTYRVVAWGCGRLVAAPTGVLGCVSFNGAGGFGGCVPVKRVGENYFLF